VENVKKKTYKIGSVVFTW